MKRRYAVLASLLLVWPFAAQAAPANPAANTALLLSYIEDLKQDRAVLQEKIDTLRLQMAQAAADAAAKAKDAAAKDCAKANPKEKAHEPPT